MASEQSRDRAIEIADARDVRRNVLVLAWPVMAEIALQTLVQIVDMAMVGRLGPVAVAAVGMSMQPLFVLFSLVNGLSVGATALVARFSGAEKRDMADLATGQAAWVSALMGGAIWALTTFLAGDIVGLMGPEPEVRELGARYLIYVAPGIAAMIVSFVLSAALRGAGDTVTPMRINVAINAVNVFGNYVLIFGKFGLPALGLVGAAISTSLARTLGAAVLLHVLLAGRSTLRMSPSSLLSIRTDLLLRMFRVGAPAAMERLAMSVGQFFYVRAVSGLGTVVFAAHTLAINAEALSYMPGLGFATAATTLVGQGLGAGRPDLARRSALESCKLGSYVMGFMAVVFLVAPELLMRIYTTDEAVIHYGGAALRVAASAQIPMALSFILAGALRGAGDTSFVFWATVAGMFAVRLPLAYVMVSLLKLGLVGAWIAMAADWFARVLLISLRFRAGRWQHIKV